MNLSGKHNATPLQQKRSGSTTACHGKSSVAKLTCGPPREKAREQPNFEAVLAEQLTRFQRIEEQLERGLGIARTAEQALDELVGQLDRMGAIVERGSPGDFPGELVELVSGMDRIVGAARFDDQPLLTGVFSGGLELTVGWEAGNSQSIRVITLPCLTPSVLGIDVPTLQGSFRQGPRAAAERIASAARDVKGTLNALRGVLTQLGEAEARLSVASENCSAASSRPLDLDALFGVEPAQTPSPQLSPA